MVNDLPPILDIGGVLISSDILTECFCCDYEKCKGICCIEGDAGAPVTLEEIGEIENMLDDVWADLSPQAQAVIDRQGVAYTDEEGDLVTSIVGGKDCVFTCYDGDNCLCALEKVCRTQYLSPNTQHPARATLACYQRDARTPFIKPISCALYPIREKRFSDGTVALNYHRWTICECGRKKGLELDMRVYQFLKEPLIRRFGEDWYQELCDVASSDLLLKGKRMCQP